MKKAFLLILILVSFNLKAITWEIIGPCQIEPLYKGQLHLKDLSQNVGLVSLSVFEDNKIPFQGNEGTIKHIDGFPGDNDFISIGPNNYRSLGWCYEINGQQPPLYMDKVFFKSNSDHLTWVLGQASFIDGKWTEYCTPVFSFEYPFFCSNK
ncbi:hypothetical protein OAK75_04500 [Bacteriovoracales bacterium]|nr:hypothetical protein [Bacteriovoracales bacterium]